MNSEGSCLKPPLNGRNDGPVDRLSSVICFVQTCACAKKQAIDIRVPRENIMFKDPILSNFSIMNFSSGQF